MPYSPRYYDPRAYVTSSTTSGGATMSDRAASVWALQLELASGFPVSYPRTFDTPPLRLSSLDLTPDGTDLGPNFHEGRLLETPTLTSTGLDEFGGVRDGESLQFRATGKPPHGGLDLHTWVGLEHRGKPVDGWLVDLDPTTLVPEGATQVFRGEIVAMADDPAAVHFLVRVFDVFALTQTLPPLRVDTSWAPYAPAAGLGQVVPYGVGIGRRIRCPCVKARSFDDTLVTVTATASAATDVLTVAGGYDWQTGDGPLRVTSTGTLPAPLLPGVDYFAIAVDQDTQLRLATTRGNALAGTFVDLTSAGTGTLTVASGLPPNLDASTDFVVGIGNVAVCQVWLDGETELPEWPLDYQVLTQEYRAGGRYLTVLRFPDELQDAVVEADVLRVDPDADGSSTLDLKFTRGFQDDARQWAVELVGTDTGDLVRGAHRFRLGAWAPPGGLGQLLVPPEAARMPTRSIHVVWTAPGVSAGDAVLWSDGALTLAWRAGTQQLQVTMAWQRQAGDPGTGESLTTIAGVPVTVWSALSGTNTVLAGSANDILLRVDQATGTIDLLLNGAPVGALSHTKAGAVPQFVTAPVVGEMSGLLHRVQVRARVVGADEHTRALWRWRRNGVDWVRELLETAGLVVDPLYAELGAANWHSVEAGALVVDGWMTQETELRAAVLAVAIMRAIWFTFTAAGIRINTPYASPSLTATLGHGDAYGNLVALPTRTRASMTEAPRELQVRFRRQRAAGTDTVEFGQSITRPVFAAGATPLALELPFCDDVSAADIVSDWVTKRLVARDQLIQLEAGREARDVQVGQVVQLAIPQMGIALDQAEVIARERSQHHQQLTVVPWAAAAFTYTPQLLPPDPMEPFFEPVQLGDTPQLLVSHDGPQVRVEFVPASLRVDRPIGDVSVTVSGVPVIVSRMSGASTLAPLSDEIDDPVLDNDTTAIRVQRSVIDGSTTSVYFGFRWPPLEADVVPISVVIRTTARAGAVDETVFGWSPYTLIVPGFPGTALTLPGGGGYLTEIRPLIMDYYIPWSRLLVNSQAFGFGATVAQNLYVTRVLREIVYRIPVTRDVRIRYFRTGPSVAPPPQPAPESAPTIEADDFGPQLDAPDGTGVFWYWATVYDVVGRLLATVGPVAVTI